MKKVIRLTESDLVRLVKRVLKEETCPKEIKVKVISTQEVGKAPVKGKNGEVLSNVVLYNLQVVGGQVRFNIYRAGKEERDKKYDTDLFYRKCGEYGNVIYHKENLTKVFLTKEGINQIECYCRQFVSTGSQPSTMA